MRLGGTAAAQATRYRRPVIVMEVVKIAFGGPLAVGVLQRVVGAFRYAFKFSFAFFLVFDELS